MLKSNAQNRSLRGDKGTVQCLQETGERVKKRPDVPARPERLADERKKREKGIRSRSADGRTPRVKVTSRDSVKNQNAARKNNV